MHRYKHTYPPKRRKKSTELFHQNSSKHYAPQMFESQITFEFVLSCIRNENNFNDTFFFFCQTNSDLPKRRSNMLSFAGAVRGNEPGTEQPSYPSLRLFEIRMFHLSIVG
ncbi:hypothetical protein CDAR_266601 [Caerostris darwini]|uniref:Uncharacterized protein n=1 Tax=Caerostris darwini TaxID=1538125 RepID=A0AAV4QG80_9ARAC|nr:hypothetical protein CDAR_266601 [Caerostris darwini]